MSFDFNNYLVLATIKQSGHGERTLDIYSHLLKERIVLLTGPVTDESTNLVIVRLLFLKSENPDKDIFFYTNSPGGPVTAGMSIYDTINFVKPYVSTLCLDQTVSMGAFLLFTGEKGKHFTLPDSRIMIHQPLISGGLAGRASDIEIHAKELLKIKEKLNRLPAKHCDHDLANLKRDTNRDNYISTGEAKEYGLIDQVLENRVSLQA